MVSDFLFADDMWNTAEYGKTFIIHGCICECIEQTVAPPLPNPLPFLTHVHYFTSNTEKIHHQIYFQSTEQPQQSFPRFQLTLILADYCVLPRLVCLCHYHSKQCNRPALHGCADYGEDTVTQNYLERLSILSYYQFPLNLLLLQKYTIIFSCFSVTQAEMEGNASPPSRLTLLIPERLRIHTLTVILCPQ